MFFSKSPVVIIGMHRSGTTMLAQVLERSGILMGRDHTAYAESNFFQRNNIQLLQNHKADWDKPVATDELPNGFNLKNYFSEYAALLKHPTGWWPMIQSRSWGWKDPRNTYTLGSWQKLFPNLHALHIYRNGLNVARSLYERNSMLQPGSKWHSPLLTDLKSCFNLWEQYTLQALSCKNNLNQRYLSIRYEDLITCKKDAIEKLETFTHRKIEKALSFIVNQERVRSKHEPIDEMESLKEHARTNQTLSRLGYVVE